VAEDVQVRRAAVDQADGDAAVDRMQDGALPLDPEQVAALAALDDQPLGRAREEVGDDRVDGDPPSRDRDPGLAGRDEHGAETALARLQVELTGRGHLPDRAVGADGQHDRGVDLEVRAGCGAQIVGRLAQVAQLDAVLVGQLGQAGDVVEADVEAVLEVEPMRDAALEQLLPVARKPAALSDDADERGIRPVLHPLVDGRDDRDAVVALAGALCVEDRDNGLAPVPQDAAQRLAVVHVVRERLSEDQVLLL
jgi:hypothetical protein